ncbi:MAG: ABC transporter substrate-binding protein [Candidatus Saccharimonadia bacterium]
MDNQLPENSTNAQATEPNSEQKAETYTSEVTDSNSAEKTAPGGELSPQPAQPSLAADPTLGSVGPVNSSPKRGKSVGALIVVLILIIIAGTSSYYYLKSKKNSLGTTQAASKPIQVLRIAIQGPFNLFYPNNDGFIGDTETQFDLTDALVRFENVTQLSPQLAVSWENPDSSTWIFHLRKNVLFHTGRVMSSADVKYSLLAVASLNLGQFTSSIKDIETPDPLTVKITTNGPDPVLLNQLSQLSIIDSQDKTSADPNAGTGPYMLKPGTTPTENGIDLVAFDKYWGGKPLTRELIYTNYLRTEDPKVLLASGKEDFVGDINIPFLPGVRAAGYSVYKPEGDSVRALWFNVLDKNSPTSSLLVRQAVEEAVNQQGMITASQVDATPATQMVPEIVPGFNPSITFPARNIQKAKQLLVQAGYPNGVTLSFTYLAPDNPGVGEELVKELAPAGITVKLDPQTQIAAIGQKVSTGKAEMWWEAENSSILDLSDVVTSTLYKSVTYDNPTLDSLTDQAAATFDSSTRLKILQNLSATIATDIPAVPMNVAAYNYVYRSTLKGISQYDVDNTPGIHWWQVHE